MVLKPDQEKLALVMVGLPARGKTSVARKMQRYLSWLGYRTFWVNVGDYRRARAGAKQPAAYFAPDNPTTRDERLGFAVAALEDLLVWFRQGGEVGIYDATNTELERRAMIKRRLLDEGIQPLFVEIICDDPEVIAHNVRDQKLKSPDYQGMHPSDAVEDFFERIRLYASTYRPVDDDEGSYVKLIDAGQKVVVNRIEGYLSARLVFFLTHIHPHRRRIWLTRHGESTFNVLGRIGGDPSLTERGREYGRALGRFIAERVSSGPPPLVLTSTLQRTIETAALLPYRAAAWRALNEIDAGVCDGLTYEEIRDRWPEEYATRSEDKFRYRYPRGESYLDVIQRLEPVIVEIERRREPVLVIGHQAVLRALYGYFAGIPQDECPHIDLALHTVVELSSAEAGYDDRRFQLIPP
jgi:broad specificity phosphatase PhoE